MIKRIVICLLVLFGSTWGIRHHIPLEDAQFDSTFMTTSSKSASSTYIGWDTYQYVIIQYRFSGSVAIPSNPVVADKGSQYSLSVELNDPNGMKVYMICNII